MKYFQWSRLSLLARVGILAVVGLVIGGFVQGEYDRWAFPGFASVIAFVFLAFIAQQGWSDASTDKAPK